MFGDTSNILTEKPDILFDNLTNELEERLQYNNQTDLIIFDESLWPAEFRTQDNSKNVQSHD